MSASYVAEPRPSFAGFGTGRTTAELDLGNEVMDRTAYGGYYVRSDVSACLQKKIVRGEVLLKYCITVLFSERTMFFLSQQISISISISQISTK
jgi:hypothetical protein